MAVCKYCGQEMTAHTSCLPKLSIDGVIYDRIKYGDEKKYNPKKQGPICGDCGCNLGDFHHFNCDTEESPVTHEQLLMSIITKEAEIYPVKE